MIELRSKDEIIEMTEDDFLDQLCTIRGQYEIKRDTLKFNNKYWIINRGE